MGAGENANVLSLLQPRTSAARHHSHFDLRGMSVLLDLECLHLVVLGWLQGSALQTSMRPICIPFGSYQSIITGGLLRLCNPPRGSCPFLSVKAGLRESKSTEIYRFSSIKVTSERECLIQIHASSR
jgi:hypothetical protein